MILATVGHNFQYELEKLCRIFLPFEKIVFSTEIVKSEPAALTILEQNSTETTLIAELFLSGQHLIHKGTLSRENPDWEKESERILAVLLFRCFVDLTGYRPQWGILTGVRPAKLFSRLAKSEGEAAAERYFADQLLVAPEKIELCSATMQTEAKILSLSRNDSFSLYLSVPFCPSRCAYCSFVSHSVAQAKKLIPKYVELLCEELRQTGRIAAELGLRLETVYIGGGTPTTLSATQLKGIMATVREAFDLSHLREYTVEAGRPDTITPDKLEAILKGGATRISINPQTMNREVLEVIGRRHTPEQTLEAFYLARETGFTNINMDLIAGLPGDTPDRFRQTLSQIISLDPENVTVHALSMKRASRLQLSGALPDFKTGQMAAEMTRYANKALRQAGILPYYMYRQSKTVGNLENVGYAKPGFEGLYNVYIMDETHTILACGASAVTKLRQPGGDFIERIFNFKYPYEYISRFSEISARKVGIHAFYHKYGQRNQSAD